MHWIERAQQLKAQAEDFAVVTLLEVQGHAPRGSGSKMLITPDRLYGTIGGGNLEHSAVQRARVMLQDKQAKLELLSLTLNPKGGEYGVQCCGGKVQVLLEIVRSTGACVAIFGAGHVGQALAKVLAILPIALRVIDARAEQLEQLQQSLPESLAALHCQHVRVPESCISDLPPGSHVLVLTHDHAEDLAIIERALQRQDLGYIGLIGSRVKWQHFQTQLRSQGLSDEDLARVTTPIGLPEVSGKTPQAIAIATAAQLLAWLEWDETAL